FACRIARLPLYVGQHVAEACFIPNPGHAIQHSSLAGIEVKRSSRRDRNSLFVTKCCRFEQCNLSVNLASKPRKGRPPIEGRVIRAAGAIALFSFLRERGIDSDPLVAEIGLPREAFAHPDNFIPLVALGRLFARAAERTGLFDIGLAVGARMTF